MARGGAERPSWPTGSGAAGGWAGEREGVRLGPERGARRRPSQSRGFVVVVVIVRDRGRAHGGLLGRQAGGRRLHVLGRAGHQLVFVALRLVVFLLAARLAVAGRAGGSDTAGRGHAGRGLVLGEVAPPPVLSDAQARGDYLVANGRERRRRRLGCDLDPRF